MNWTEMILPIASGFGITVATMPLFIGYFQIKKYGQEILEEGPNWHQAKAGTPTMGGTVFLIAIIISALWVAVWQQALTPALWISLFILLVYGGLGFLDDFIKIFRKRNMGLNSKQKLIGQIIGGIIFYAVLVSEGATNTVNVFGYDLHLSFLYGLFIIVWLVGFSNAVNLTDGIDGLVSGLGAISFATYAIIAWNQQQYDILILCLSVS